MMTFQADEDFARQLDAAAPLTAYRERFARPRRPDGESLVYLCSHSLGLPPRAARETALLELDRWAALGVQGHFQGDPPWYTYQEPLRPLLARLVGATPDEVVLMNGLTVNLHLMLETFYRPRPDRFRLLLDDPPFPSDLYALQSQLRRHGHDPATDLLTLRPRPGEGLIRIEDIEEFLERRGKEIAVVVWNVVNFLTGQFHDVPRLAAAAKRQGCVVGLDLAHAIGNVPLALGEWGVDFAVWCSYKYLCGGPGAVGGCYVAARHARQVDRPRLAGWWGNDPAARFRMQLEPTFTARPDAGGWQVSNPPVLALAPLHASVPIFDEVGMPALRRRSQQLTAYLEYLLDRRPGRSLTIVTPRSPEQRGCQLSLRVPGGARRFQQELEAQGVVGDFREPDVVRLAPAPMYNTFHDVWRAAQAIAKWP
jgi:kynureninase